MFGVKRNNSTEKAVIMVWRRSKILEQLQEKELHCLVLTGADTFLLNTYTQNTPLSASITDNTGITF